MHFSQNSQLLEHDNLNNSLHDQISVFLFIYNIFNLLILLIIYNIFLFMYNIFYILKILEYVYINACKNLEN